VRSCEIEVILHSFSLWTRETAPFLPCIYTHTHTHTHTHAQTHTHTHTHTHTSYCFCDSGAHTHAHAHTHTHTHTHILLLLWFWRPVVQAVWRTIVIVKGNDLVGVFFWCYLVLDLGVGGYSVFNTCFNNI
jgi:hypothetical protein